jgi:hypothetical protein
VLKSVAINPEVVRSIVEKSLWYGFTCFISTPCHELAGGTETEDEKRESSAMMFHAETARN